MGPTETSLLKLLIPLGAIVTTILWLIIGWRAMRAHEKLAAEAQAARGTFDKLQKDLEKVTVIAKELERSVQRLSSRPNPVLEGPRQPAPSLETKG